MCIRDRENIKFIVSGASGLARESVLVVAVKEQEPETIKIEDVSNFKELSFKQNHYLLLMIPCLIGGLVVVRRLDASSRKNINKILKIENEKARDIEINSQ